MIEYFLLSLLVSQLNCVGSHSVLITKLAIWLRLSSRDTS